MDARTGFAQRQSEVIKRQPSNESAVSVNIDKELLAGTRAGAADGNPTGSPISVTQISPADDVLREEQPHFVASSSSSSTGTNYFGHTAEHGHASGLVLKDFSSASASALASDSVPRAYMAKVNTSPSKTDPTLMSTADKIALEKTIFGAGGAIAGS